MAVFRQQPTRKFVSPHRLLPILFSSPYCLRNESRKGIAEISNNVDAVVSLKSMEKEVMAPISKLYHAMEMHNAASCCIRVCTLHQDLEGHVGHSTE